MAKGIIVMDDIPVICAECNFATITPNKECLRCEAKNRIIYNAKPDWCPIKEIPARKEAVDVSNPKELLKTVLDSGFNACLDEIEGKMQSD